MILHVLLRRTQNYNFKLCLEGSQPLFFTCLNFQLDATVECRVNRLSGTPSKSRHDKPSILYSLPNPLILNTVYPTPYYGCIELNFYLGMCSDRSFAVIPWLLPSRYRSLLPILEDWAIEIFTINESRIQLGCVNSLPTLLVVANSSP